MTTIALLGWHAVPKKRPRVTSRGTYMPGGYQDWKQETAYQLRRQWQQEPLIGHVEVGIVIAAAKKPRGDIDNLAGAVLDAGNGVVWGDDRQVASLSVCWCKPTQERPVGIYVRVREWNETRASADR